MQVAIEAAARTLAAAEAEYHIAVFTSDVKFAGTDADVFIELQGRLEGNMVSTPRLPLNSAKNDFERGREDHFTVKCVLLAMSTGCAAQHL